MISIDTDIMKELVRATSTANDAIDEAVEVLNKITIHNDWGCKEKNSINNYTTSNKNKIKTLQEHSRSFLSILSSVSAEFENSENRIKDMFQSVESLLGKVFSTLTGGQTSAASGSQTSDISSIITGTKQTLSYEIVDGKVVWKPSEATTNPFDGLISGRTENPYIYEKLGPGATTQDLIDGFKNSSAFEKFEMTNISENISMCDYSSFSNLGSSDSK